MALLVFLGEERLEVKIQVLKREINEQKWKVQTIHNDNNLIIELRLLASMHILNKLIYRTTGESCTEN